MNVQKDIKFYDTSSLLLLREEDFKQDEKFLISSVSLQELESYGGDREAKQWIIELLNKYSSSYEVIVHRTDYELEIENCYIEIDDNMKILSDAIHCNNIEPYIDRVVFVTNSLYSKSVANLFFGDRMVENQL